MKKILLTIGFVVLVLLGMYLGAPLIVDDIVDEAFPEKEETMMEDEEQMTEEDEAMLLQLETMTEAEVEAMSDREMMEMKEMMDELSEKMPDEAVQDTMPKEAEATGPQVVLSGSFEGADSFHKGSGTASIYALEDGSNLLRFENFSVTNGPALHVFVVLEDGTRVDLGDLKGNMGNQNYTVPASVDVRQVSYVQIYCVPFKVEFARANFE